MYLDTVDVMELPEPVLSIVPPCLEEAVVIFEPVIIIIMITVTITINVILPVDSIMIIPGPCPRHCALCTAQTGN